MVSIALGPNMPATSLCPSSARCRVANAAPAEEKSFGEWLQALGWSVNSVETNFREKGCQILGNKYKSKSNPNFGREYDEASKGLVIGTTPGIGNETVTKASACIRWQKAARSSVLVISCGGGNAGRLGRFIASFYTRACEKAKGPRETRRAPPAPLSSPPPIGRR